MTAQEREILEALDAVLRKKSTAAILEQFVKRVERKLTLDPDALLAWEPVPLGSYGERLPEMIFSSWVFILRAGSVTGAERHPNSHQRVVSYRGSGDLQVWRGDRWHSNHLVSDFEAPLERRWLSIPVNVWHQAVVPAENWVVVSFHTVPADQLIEERPDPADEKLTRQRRYLDVG